MNTDVLMAVLTDELEAKKDGDSYSIPSRFKVTVLVQSDGDVVPVARVTSVRISDNYLTFVTEDGHFFIEPSRVFAVKSEGESSSEKRPGFH